MSPLAEWAGEVIDPDRGAAVATAIVMVATVVLAPRHVRARWWAAIWRES